jgi:hypothetical protein
MVMLGEVRQGEVMLGVKMFKSKVMALNLKLNRH